jgi:hypothetical protein
MKCALFRNEMGIFERTKEWYRGGDNSHPNSLTMIRISGWIIALPIVLSASSLSAQQGPVTDFQKPQTRTVRWNGQDVPLRQNLISVNPLGIVFGYFSAEAEHAFSMGGSVALNGSYDGTGDFGYSSADVILRYYPSLEMIRGFAIGGTVGYTHVSSDLVTFADCSGCTFGNGASNAFTLGIQGDYSWWIGRDQRFGIELGLGAKRLFYHGGGRRGSEALPTGRLSIGWGF